MGLSVSAELVETLERERYGELAALERESFTRSSRNRPPPPRKPVVRRPWVAPPPISHAQGVANRQALLEALIGIPHDGEPLTAAAAAARRRRSA